MLDANEGIGIMLETEIDTLVNASNVGLGDSSDMWRKAWENESYSLYRKTKREHIFIPNIKASSVLTGTPGQFRKLMTSAENGLFSRGCYYIFKDPSDKLHCYGRFNSEIDIDAQFAIFSKRALKCYQSVMQEQFVSVMFTEDQLRKIQDILQHEYELVRDVPALHANVKRAFTIVLKIAAILACLDMAERDRVLKHARCPQLYLKASIDLTLVYLKHGFDAYDLLPKQKAVNGKGVTVNMQRLLSLLPDEFSRAEAIGFGEELKVHTKTVDNILKTCVSLDKLEKTGHGNFKKIKSD